MSTYKVWTERETEADASVCLTHWSPNVHEEAAKWVASSVYKKDPFHEIVVFVRDESGNVYTFEVEAIKAVVRFEARKL